MTRPGRFVMRVLALGMIAFGIATVHAMLRPIDPAMLDFKGAPARMDGGDTAVTPDNPGEVPGATPTPPPVDPERSGNQGESPAQPVVTPPSPKHEPHPDDIGLEEAVELFKMGAIFVDARSKEEYEAGHIQGAMSLSLEAIARSDPSIGGKLDLLRAGFPIVIYCKGADCTDSHDLKRRLEGIGITNMKVFTGGFPEWQQAGHLVETGPEP